MGNNRMMMGSSSVVLPTAETYLLQLSVQDATKTQTITIPSGVKVLKLVLIVNDAGEGEQSQTIAYLRNGSKEWAYGSVGMMQSYALTKYIGVTPNKSYTLTFYSSSWMWGSANFSLTYSASINKQTPTVTDY